MYYYYNRTRVKKASRGPKDRRQIERDTARVHYYYYCYNMQYPLENTIVIVFVVVGACGDGVYGAGERPALAY